MHARPPPARSGTPHKSAWCAAGCGTCDVTKFMHLSKMAEVHGIGGLLPEHDLMPISRGTEFA